MVLSLLTFENLGLSQRKTGLIKKSLTFLFNLNAWEIPEGLYFLLLYKDIGLISMRLAQQKYKDRKIHNIILVIICNL